MKRLRFLFAAVLACVVVAAAALSLRAYVHTPPGPTPLPGYGTTDALATATSAPSTPSAPPAATLTATPGDEPAPGTPTSAPNPMAAISTGSLLAYSGDLVAIQPYSGWRSSASQGEAEALEYVEQTLDGFTNLKSAGLRLEPQSFDVPVSTELWESRLTLRVGGDQIDVPANGLLGPRAEITRALQFDSDGMLNDSKRDPVTVQGQVVVIRSGGDVKNLSPADLDDKIVFLDYAAIDPFVQGGAANAAEIVRNLLMRRPAGLVLVTLNSDRRDASHGSFAEDASALQVAQTGTVPPTLVARLEDMGGAGIKDWQDLQKIDTASITWDADVFSPASSGNLAAYIPGRDPSRVIILGAHLDSANTPGAMDDASGSAVLLEVARALDASHTQPPHDLVLVWFGSEELGLKGSAYFAATHGELLARTVAMLQIDCLTRPIEGITADLTLVAASRRQMGSSQSLWPDLLAQTAAGQGMQVETTLLSVPYSDNSSFDLLDVPNADLIYVNEPAMAALGPIHYAAHLHDPYDTMDAVRRESSVLEQMARVAMLAAMTSP